MVVISASDEAQEKKYKPLVVRAPDGVTIAAQEWGSPTGSEILFIHGFSQASMSWQRQVECDLAKEFRLVTYDLRGHGNSDKPLEPEKYKESKAWADEVQAIIDAANFKRPVERVVGIVVPASENLRTTRLMHCSKTVLFDDLVGG